VNLSTDDVVAIREHSTLISFGWSGEDVPIRIWKPVVDAIDLLAPALTRPEERLDQHPS